MSRQSLKARLSRNNRPGAAVKERLGNPSRSVDIRNKQASKFVFKEEAVLTQGRGTASKWVVARLYAGDRDGAGA